MRYLQYLLSIDYFSLPGQEKVDKSNWVASLTSISGCLNGSVSAHASCVDDKFFMASDKSNYIETFPADATACAFKAFAFI